MPTISNLRAVPCHPPIGIYMGAGASHSWLWFVEILDRMGLYDVLFVDENDIQTAHLDRVAVLLMSGGDPFGIAEGLGTEGSKRLRHFVEGGGLYIGTCAGAYLPLRSSMNLLDEFNFIDVKISNISRRLPDCERPLLQKSVCSSYGCDLIFHAVREDVVLEMVNGHNADGRKEVIAPLYGGPSMLPSRDIEPVAYYKGFTKKTKFLVREELAGKTLLGNIAVAKKSMGDGHLYIFGPHFEHPNYPSCNLFLRDIILNSRTKRSRRAEMEFSGNHKNPVQGETLKDLLVTLKRQLSNARIRASGMNDLSARWLIGNKVYDPEKINVFISFIWNKLRYFERLSVRETDREPLFRCVETAQRISEDLIEIKSEMKRQGDATSLASGLFQNLKMLSSSFLSLYLKAKKDRFCDCHPGERN